jgi:hypothetical protein
MDLRDGRESAYWCVEIRQYHIAGGEGVGEDTAAGTHINLDSELVHEPERRSLSGGGAYQNRQGNGEAKQNARALHDNLLLY